MLDQCCNYLRQGCNNVVMLCPTENRRCKLLSLLRVTSLSALLRPLRTVTTKIMYKKAWCTCRVVVLVIRSRPLESGYFWNYIFSKRIGLCTKPVKPLTETASVSKMSRSVWTGPRPVIVFLFGHHSLLLPSSDLKALIFLEEVS